MIKFIKSPTGIGYGYFSGETAELKQEIERKLIESKYAIAIDPDVNDGLPEDFPAREIFHKLGFVTMDQIKSIDDLTELEGIGKAIDEKVNKYIAENE